VTEDEYAKLHVAELQDAEASGDQHLSPPRSCLAFPLLTLPFALRTPCYEIHSLSNITYRIQRPSWHLHVSTSAERTTTRFANTKQSKFEPPRLIC